MADRPSWDEWGLGIATAVATRADCSRRRIGAVIMRPDHAIVATGYNGGPVGGKSCLAGQCPRGLSDVTPGTSYDTGAGACIAVHAEQNAIHRASWADMVGSTIYVTDVPCGGCERSILGTPLHRIVWPTGTARVVDGEFRTYARQGVS